MTFRSGRVQGRLLGNYLLYVSHPVVESDTIRYLFTAVGFSPRDSDPYARTAGYTWTDYKTNTQIAKELKITPILDRLLEYKRNWMQRVNRMPRNRLPRVMKHYSPAGRRNHGRLLKRLIDTRDRNGSTSGPTP
jgi:hypothetical protein